MRITYYAKTPKSEVLRSFDKNIKLIIFNIPKSEVLRIKRKNSKTGGFAPSAKLQNRRFCIHRKNSKIGGLA